MQILGNDPNRSTFSFHIQGLHHADIAAILNEQHIAIRVGEHCAKPYLRYLKQMGTLRISLAHYNTEQDIEHFMQALTSAIKLFEE